MRSRGSFHSTADRAAGDGDLRAIRAASCGIGAAAHPCSGLAASTCAGRLARLAADTGKLALCRRRIRAQRRALRRRSERVSVAGRLRCRSAAGDLGDDRSGGRAAADDPHVKHRAASAHSRCGAHRCRTSGHPRCAACGQRPSARCDRVQPRAFHVGRSRSAAARRAGKAGDRPRGRGLPRVIGNAGLRVAHTITGLARPRHTPHMVGASNAGRACIQLAKGGDPMSHGSAVSSVRFVRGLRG